VTRLPWMLSWLLVTIGAFALLAVAVRLLEARLAFFPSPGEDVTPATLDLAFDGTFVETSDDQRLRVWSLPHEDARAIVVYFHGNGGNLTIWAPILAGIHREGFTVHALDYRGYGLSTGSPSERGLFRDVEAFVAWTWQRTPSPVPVVYWGRSLGGTMAAYAATIRPPDGIILESSFPDVRALLRESPLMAFLARFSSYRFSTTTFLRDVDRPVLVIHGDADRIVPFTAGRALYDAISGRKQFVTIARGDHNDAIPQDAATYWSAVSSFVASLREQSQSR
jgi:uncharacterized protein